MNRSWTVGIALGVLGIVAFLVWAVRSNPLHGIELRFLGYQTNRTDRVAPLVPYPAPEIYARFSLTNGSRRAIAFDTFDGRPLFSVATNSHRRWSEVPEFFFGFRGFNHVVLHSTETITFIVRDPDTNQPLRVTISYSPNVIAGTNNSWIPFTPPRLSQTFVPVVANNKPVINSVVTTLWIRVKGWFHRAPAPPSVSITIQD